MSEHGNNLAFGRDDILAVLPFDEKLPLASPDIAISEHGMTPHILYDLFGRNPEALDRTNHAVNCKINIELLSPRYELTLFFLFPSVWSSYLVLHVRHESMKVPSFAHS